MKNRLFKRLSAFAAGTAVALTGALAAMPAAHAASTYTLAQVGGTAEVKSLMYQGAQVKGHYANGIAVNGLVVPAGGYGINQLTMGIEAVVPLSQVAGGDTVNVPLTSIPRGKALFYSTYSCNPQDVSIGDVPVAKMSCTSDGVQSTLILKFYDEVSQFTTLNLKTAVFVRILGDAPNVEPEDIQYSENELYVGVGASKFFYEKLPYTGSIGGGVTVQPSWLLNYTGGLGYTQLSGYIAAFGRNEMPSLANYVLRGDYTNKSPQVNANRYSVYRLDTLSGATIDGLRVITEQPRMATSCDWFALGRTGTVDEKTSMFTQKNLPQDALLADFNAVDGLLAPGEYAIINNTDGTIDVAINYGSFYNNPRNKYPDSYAYNYAPADVYSNPDECIAQANANINALRAGGYGVADWATLFNVQLNNSQYSQGFTRTAWHKLYDQTYTRTEEGYWDAVDTTGSGTVAQSFIAYDANGGSGAVPANTVGNVGSSVSVANQGALARTGYTFTGWNTAKDGKGTSYKAGDSYTLTREGLKLYAQWTANKYSVTFNKNATDATGSTANLTNQTYGTKVNLTANGFSRTGYTFKGWNTKADGTGTSYGDKAQFTIPAGNTTLYAQWLSDSVVPYPGVKPEGYKTVTFAPGANGTLSGTTVFYVDPTKNVTLVAPTVKPNTGFAFSKWDKSYANVKFTGDTTITAQYTTVPDVVDGGDQQPTGYVKVTFAKGASGSLSGETSFWVNPSKTVSLTAPTVKANTGYVFDRWDTNFTNVKFAGATTITALYKVEELVEIYRMYDGIEHLYVNTTTERDALVARGWKYEGVAFSTPATSSTAVHRLFQPATGDHHYTSDPTEIDALKNKHGWKDEGVLFYGDDAKRVELKRLFMAGLGKGEHLHTADANELKALTEKHGWELEGISFYVAKYGS